MIKNKIRLILPVRSCSFRIWRNLHYDEAQFGVDVFWEDTLYLNREKLISAKGWAVPDIMYPVGYVVGWKSGWQ